MWQRIKNIYHLFIAVSSNVIFGFPAKKLKVIGVTGTDGKTTTVYLIDHILETAGYKASMVSSIGARINRKEFDTGFHVTTPSSFSLQRFLKKAKKAGTEYFVLETTSHALDQNRVWGIPFKIGVVTNVTAEHLDYHKTYEDYLKTKKKLLKIAEIAVVNRDDSSFTYFSDLKKEKKTKWVEYGKLKKSVVASSLPGEFNRYNASAAIAVCKLLGVEESSINKALKSFELPLGRLDFVYSEDFKVMIDFAHTPNAFEKLLGFLRPLTDGRIIHVFGSAGERDKIKRKTMGEISSNFSNIIILTSEDPRRENPEKIIEEIESGIKNPVTKLYKIPDRKKAIKKAMQIAKTGDLVLLTGKAHEKSMNMGHGEEAWDEYKEVQKNLVKIGEGEAA